MALIIRRLLWLLTTTALMGGGVAVAETTTSLPKVGYLAWSSCKTPDDLVVGLTDWGRIPGKSVQIICESAHGKTEGLPPAALALVDLQVDVIVTMSQPAGQAARKATRSIPIVTIISGDPVASGLAQSLAKPGSNLTGVTYYATELTAKRLDLLDQMLPSLSSIGVLANPDVSYLPFEADAKRAADSLGLRTVVAYAREPSELPNAFSKLTTGGVQAVFVLPDVMFSENGKVIADLALSARLPSMGWGGWYTDEGMLMAYSADYRSMQRRLGFYVSKVLDGTPPGDLPIEQPTRFELSINANTAQQLGIVIPPSILIQAAKVVE